MTATAQATELADRIASAVRAHPAVAELHGGPFGTVASYLVGRRVVGVRATDPGEPVELAVVLRHGHPAPTVAAELRAAVRRLAGPVRVDVLIADLVTDQVAGRVDGQFEVRGSVDPTTADRGRPADVTEPATVGGVSRSRPA